MNTDAARRTCAAGSRSKAVARLAGVTFRETDNGGPNMTTEKDLDIAEAALMQKVREGDTDAVITFLEAKGRSRGYGVMARIDDVATRDERAEARARLLDMLEDAEDEDRAALRLAVDILQVLDLFEDAGS